MFHCSVIKVLSDFVVLSFLASAFDIISKRKVNVNNFFKLFSFSFFPFERRRGDLNPRTAHAIYTLSRGASSAT